MRTLHKRSTLGFTLVEIMVAIVILGITMTAIFSSEAGAISAGHRARMLGTATLLARCKMGELEELVAKEGLPAVDDGGKGECCEGIDDERFTCHWDLTRIELPEPSEDNPLGEMGSMFGGEGDEKMDKGTAIDGILSGGVGDISEIAFNIAFPTLKPEIEERVRRATVRIEWSEGSATRDFDVTQFLVQVPQ